LWRWLQTKTSTANCMETNLNTVMSQKTINGYTD
jgi:hypothetical protein